MKNKIRSNALSQGLGDKINSEITPDNISVIMEDGNYKLIFIMNETTTLSYPYTNKDDLDNDFKFISNILEFLV